MGRLPALAVVFAIAACGGSGTSPTTVPSAQPPPSAPTPSPNPFAAACGTPLPPMEHAYGFGVKVQLEPTRNKKILNASPLIKNMEYCAAAGFANTTICNTRKEDHPERIPCDHYLSGMSDQGRPGPNWFEDLGFQDEGGQQLAKCGEPETNCELKQEDQYLLDIHAVGRYVACAGKGTTGTCGDCIIETMARSGSTAGLCKHQ